MIWRARSPTAVVNTSPKAHPKISIGNMPPSKRPTQHRTAAYCSRKSSPGQNSKPSIAARSTRNAFNFTHLSIPRNLTFDLLPPAAGPSSDKPALAPETPHLRSCAQKIRCTFRYLGIDPHAPLSQRDHPAKAHLSSNRLLYDGCLGFEAKSRKDSPFTRHVADLGTSPCRRTAACSASND